ncbi:MAG: hypothetical protein WCP96_07125 [Methylococcaceae bacterium]
MITDLFMRFLTDVINKFKSISCRKGLYSFLMLLGISCQSNAAWLSMCPDLPLSVLNNRDEGYFSHFLNAQEKIIILRITATKPENPGCETKELPVGADKVSWAGFAKPAINKARQIALQGRELNGHFAVSEIIVPDASDAALATLVDKPKPVYRPLLTAKARRFLPLRAGWFWSPDSWLIRPQKIFDSQTTLGLKRIYMTVPVSKGQVQHREQLRKFLQIAHQHGLQVWAVLGDPEAVLEREKQSFLALVHAYQVFNTDGGQQKLDGLQLDIEPYLLPGYQLNPAIWLQAEAKTVNAAHQIAPSLLLDMVLPFWFEPLQGDAAKLLADVEASIGSITVMNYRTDPEQIREFAEKFLAWGELRQKPVYIALESLPIQEEDLHAYREADSGELWQFDFKTSPVLVLLREQVQQLPGGKAYRLSHSRKIDGSGTSFFRQPGELMKLLPTLETQFGAWSSFAGIALHGQE